MTSVIKYDEGIDSVAIIGNYLPRQCGTAAFTTELKMGIHQVKPKTKWAFSACRLIRPLASR